MGYIGNEPTTGHFPVDNFTSSGGSTYTLAKAPASAGAIEVSVQGVLQPTTAYTVSGTTLTMAGVTSGVKIFVRHLGETLSLPTPADGSVTATKLAVNSVDGTKIAMGSDAQGDILYHGASDYARLAKGTAGQVLTMNSGATAPEWAAAAGVTPKMKLLHSSFAFSGAPGTQTLSGVGFAPDVIYGMWGVGNDTFKTPNIFWAINPSSSLAQSGTRNFNAWRHNEKSTAGTWMWANAGMQWIDSHSAYVQGTVTTWGSDGITITYTVTGSPGTSQTMNQSTVYFKLT